VAQGKIEVSLTVVSVLKYSACAAWIVGIVYTILAGVAAGDNNWNPGTAVAATILQGMLWTLLAGGTLYGLSYIVDQLQAKGQEEEAEVSQPGQSNV
jgi:hypothetical protein